MNFDPPSAKSPKKPTPTALLVIAGIVIVASYFSGSTFTLQPAQGQVVKVQLFAGYFIGILQLVIVGAIGYWFGQMKSAGDLAPDEDAPSLGERIRSVSKSRNGAKWCGVCAGLGEHTPMPAWIWRIAFILFALANGFGLIAYVILAFAMPEAEDVKKKKDEVALLTPPDSGSMP